MRSCWPPAPVRRRSPHRPESTLPVTAEPGLLVYSRPQGPLLNGLVLAPELHMRQTAEGSVVAGADFGGGDPGKNPAATARDLFRQLQSMVTGGEALDLGGYSVGYRPMPADGFPIVGRPPGRDGLYVAVLHSGITLAPVCRQICRRRTAARPARSAAGALWAGALHGLTRSRDGTAARSRRRRRGRLRHGRCRVLRAAVGTGAAAAHRLPGARRLGRSPRRCRRCAATGSAPRSNDWASSPNLRLKSPTALALRRLSPSTIPGRRSSR